jgi:hypothetical protein
VLPTSLNVGLMLGGYLVVMSCLALGLRILRRQGAEVERWPRRGRRHTRLAPVAARRGWPGLLREVVRTAVGGYLLLMAVVVGYYHGVAHAGGEYLLSAVTGSGLMMAVGLPSSLLASWVADRRTQKRRKRTRKRGKKTRS